ncbi:MAG: cytidine deaminase [Planctomycetota bacterium]
MTELADSLIAAAAGVRGHAYAPYSKYLVGAALISQTGATYTGCNVENASYGLTICAERGAISNAVAAEGPGFRIAAIAVVTGEGATPCGACRQVVAEFANGDVPVFLADQAGKVRTTTVEALLPGAFTFAADEPPTKPSVS